MKKVVIIGGMAAGCKTAARLRRLLPEAEITIVERLPFVSFGACGMPFFASGEVEDFESLMSTAWGSIRNQEFFYKTKNIIVLTETNCSKIFPEHNFIEVVDKNGRKQILNYDYLVIATGSKPVKPNFTFPQSERVSYFHSPIDAKNFRMLAERGKISNAVIVGGGFIGCELAEAVTSLWGIEVTLIEKEASLLPRSFDQEISNVLLFLFKGNGINVMLNTSVDRIEQNNGKLFVYAQKDVIETDFVFLVLGVVPNVELAMNSGVMIGACGGISVDGHLRTNFKNIFAAGDCIEVTNLVTRRNEIFPLGSLANRQGRVVADNIAGLDSLFKGAVGSISLKVFDTIFASTGLSSYCCTKDNLNFHFAIGSFYDRPHYYPDSKVIFAKVLYEEESGKLLGLQMCGKGEVTRYIDVFATLLERGATYSDLSNVEHCYTPPHSSPLNPLNYIGGIIENQERFGLIPLSPLEFEKFKNEWFVIDLRKENEIDEMPLDCESMNVDFDNYRDELGRIDLKKNILCVCQKGPRSLEVAIHLKHLGAKKVGFLAGGIQLLRSAF
ncbi:MAG: FAD-dependent oxidoreductase [Candidatus Kapaibacteriota bacterium]